MLCGSAMIWQALTLYLIPSRHGHPGRLLLDNCHLVRQVGMANVDPLRRALQRTATRILQRSDTAAFLTSQISGAAADAGSGVGAALSV